MHPIRVLIVQNGISDPSIIEHHGNYPDWFVQALEPEGVHCQVVRAFDPGALPSLRDLDVDGVILTGSPLSVADRAPWVLEMGRWALEAAEGGTPVLAVCFGHQAVGEVLGGRVQPSPNGREYGTIAVELTEAGRRHPLFQKMPSQPHFQSVHADALVEPPPGATLLASTAHTRWQAYAWGTHLCAVQFHPELKPAALRDLCTLRNAAATVADQDDGRQLLQNWLNTLQPRVTTSGSPG